MRKFFIVASIMMVACMANAQDVNVPDKGDFALELGFNPFSNNFETFKLDGAVLRGRYFTSEKSALRLGIGFEYGHVDDGIGDAVSAGQVGVEFGYEYHWHPSGKIDLYAGPTLGFIGVFTDAEDMVEYDEDYWALQFAVGTGINYYLVKGLYLGAEVGLVVNHLISSNTDAKATTVAIEASPSLHIGWTF